MPKAGACGGANPQKGLALGPSPVPEQGWQAGPAAVGACTVTPDPAHIPVMQ